MLQTKAFSSSVNSSVSDLHSIFESEKHKFKEEKENWVGKMSKSRKLLLILYVLIVMVSMYLAYESIMFMSFMPVTRGDLEVDVNPRIYDPKNNIGVLNEEAVFDISIRNYANFSKTISVVVNDEDHVLVNKTFAVEPESTQNKNITQKLISTGLWTVKVVDLSSKYGPLIESYSFVSVINKAEADVKINQHNEIQFNKTLSITAIVIAVLSLIANVVLGIYARKQYTKDAKKNKEKQDHCNPDQTAS